jgi:hypothetical protein
MTHPFDYTDADDMRRLAELVRDVPEAFRPIIVAGVLANDLMRCQWWLRAIVAVRAGRNPFLRFDIWLAIAKRRPAEFNPLLEALAVHIVSGRDRVDPRSAGGLNGAEVDSLHGLLMALLDGMRAGLAGAGK